jgi:predicted adenylyl cyclase CyaB
MDHFEIEIKSLLGARERAQELREKFLERFPEAKLKGKHTQLNHYFIGENVSALFENISVYFSQAQQKSLETILREGRQHSLRTREADGQVLLVVKASVDDHTSANGVSRMEFEQPVELSLEALDQVLLAAGLEYQAKWSREREEYVVGEIALCLDRNAGYGYVAEFEKIVQNADEIAGAKQELLELMRELGVEELSQDRLERMFAYYNAHWREYYGTENVFVVE